MFESFGATAADARTAVRTDYTHAAQRAFTGMALAMAVLLVLAAFYPRDRRQTA